MDAVHRVDLPPSLALPGDALGVPARELRRQEVGGGYHLPQVALVLVAWSIGGLLLCRRTFRWLPLGED